MKQKLMFINLEKKNRKCIITLNRPEVLNAFNSQMLLELESSLTKMASDNDLSVLMLTGRGRAFSAGEDLKEGAAANGTTILRDKLHCYQRVTRLLRSMRQVTIAAVNGYALGGGCEIALDCDLVVASEGAKFGFPEVKVGGLITCGASKILPNLIGEKRAKELLFTGRILNANEAERLGLVNYVVPPNQLLKTAAELSEQILANAPLSVQLTKECLKLAADANFDSVLSYEAEAATICLQSRDAAEGIAAFLGKRKPKFVGK